MSNMDIVTALYYDICYAAENCKSCVSVRDRAADEIKALRSKLDAYEKGHSVELERLKGEVAVWRASVQATSQEAYLMEQVRQLQSRLSSALLELEKVAFFTETHWKGAGLPLESSWIIERWKSHTTECEREIDSLESRLDSALALLYEARKWALSYQHADGTFEEDKDIPFLKVHNAICALKGHTPCACVVERQALKSDGHEYCATCPDCGGQPHTGACSLPVFEP